MSHIVIDGRARIRERRVNRRGVARFGSAPRLASVADRPPPRLTASLAIVAGLLLPPAFAQQAPSAQTPGARAEVPAAASQSVRELSERITSLERRLGSSALIELVAKLGRLEQTIQELRGEIEVQGHELEELRSRQRDLYAELDRIGRRVIVPAPSSTEAPQDAAGEDGSEAGPGAAPAAAAAEPSDPASAPAESEPTAAAVAVPDPSDSTPSDSAPSDSTGDRPPPPDPVEEQARYQSAFDLLSEGRFSRAATAFEKFLAEYPDSRHSDNARFWLAECLYALRRFESSLEEFRKVIERYPESPKAPGAELKIGFILHELGRREEAIDALRKLVEEHPESSEAKLARDRLVRLQ